MMNLIAQRILIKRVILPALYLSLILTGIFTYRHFKPHKSLDGVWATACTHDAFYARRYIRISQNEQVAESIAELNSESCESAPSVTIHSSQELKGLNSLPNIILMNGANPILMRVNTESMAYVANIFNLYEFNHWKRGFERNVSGKKYSYIHPLEAGVMPLMDSLVVDYNGDNRILITGTSDGKPMVLNRQKNDI